MPFFEDKPEAKAKKSIEECCRQFYDCNVFIRMADGTEGWSIYLNTAFGDSTEADQSILSLKPSIFRKEMTALQMELFALAWSRKFDRGDFAIMQSIYTRSYLEENDRLDIWNIMLEYNHAIGISSITTELGEEVGNTHIARINKVRAGFRGKWLKAKNKSVPRDIDAMTQQERDEYVCICSVADRIGVDFKKVGVVLAKLLTTKLTSRLGCENIKSETLHRLAIVIISFYRGAEQYLESVTIP